MFSCRAQARHTPGILFGDFLVREFDDCFRLSMVFGGSNLKILIFHRFFNDFGRVGVKNVDFSLFFFNGS